MGEPRDPVQRPEGRRTSSTPSAAFVKNADYLGGENLVKAIATTKFQDGGLPIARLVSCFMHRQASFYASLCPEGTNIGPDGDINVLLPAQPGRRPEVHARRWRHLCRWQRQARDASTSLRYTGSVEYQTRDRQHAQGAVAEHEPRRRRDQRPVPQAALPSCSASADVFRFDGSDLMPGAVGAGTFWTEVTAWVIGGEHRRPSSTTSRPAGRRAEPDQS